VQVQAFARRNGTFENRQTGLHGLGSAEAGSASADPYSNLASPSDR